VVLGAFDNMLEAKGLPFMALHAIQINHLENSKVTEMTCNNSGINFIKTSFLTIKYESKYIITLY
jgi:hypothetical protein